jgi:hypothetical protein
MALLVGDGVDEGLKKKESYTAAKGKSRRPPNAAELKLENSRTRKPKSATPELQNSKSKKLDLT